MKRTKTNMLYGAGSRKKRKVGEYFTFSVSEGEYYWGRVICVDAVMWGFANQRLVYIYDTCTSEAAPIPELSKENLLIPPQALADFFWRDGYFQTVAIAPVEPSERFARHCFRSPIRRENEFRDEYGNVLDEPFEPISIGGAPNIRMVDTMISRALGIEPIPDDPD